MFRISIISTLAASAVKANEVDAEGRRRGGYGHGPGYGYGRPGIAPQRGPMSHNISKVGHVLGSLGNNLGEPYAHGRGLVGTTGGKGLQAAGLLGSAGGVGGSYGLGLHGDGLSAKALLGSALGAGGYGNGIRGGLDQSLDTIFSQYARKGYGTPYGSRRQLGAYGYAGPGYGRGIAGPGYGPGPRGGHDLGPVGLGYGPGPLG